MSASCPTDETERTARGGSWTVACALALRTAHPGTVPQHPGEAVATGGRVDTPGSWFPPHGCQWWREVAAVLPAGEHLKPRTLRPASAAAWRRPHDPGRTAHVLQSIPHLAWVVLVCAPIDREGPLTYGRDPRAHTGGTVYNINHKNQWLTEIGRAMIRDSIVPQRGIDGRSSVGGTPRARSSHPGGCAGDLSPHKGGAWHRRPL